MNKRKVVGAVLLGAAALVYGVSPVDLIPELLGPLGIADDAVVLSGAALGVWRLLATARKKKPEA